MSFLGICGILEECFMNEGFVQGFLRRYNEGKKPTTGDLLSFFRQVRRFHKGGISILEGLQFFYEQCTQFQLKEAVKKMIQDIKDGELISESMRQFDFFPKFCVNAIAAGEVSGTLNDIFEEIERFMEQKADIDRQMKSGLQPVKFFSVMFCLVLGIAIFVVMPMFSKMFKDLKVELPGVTAFVMGTGMGIVKYWYLVGFVLYGLFWAGKWFIREYPEKIDRLMLKVPIYSGLYYLELQYRFAKILSLVSKGVSIARGLELAAESIDHIPMARVMREAARQVSEGMMVSDAIVAADMEEFVAKETIIMIRAGEKSGQVIESLDKVADDFCKDLLNLTKTAGEKMGLSVMIPMLVIMMFVFGSVYLPIIKLMVNIGKH